MKHVNYIITIPCTVEVTISANSVCGKCSVIREEDIDGDIIEYSSQDVNRFYFMQVS